jgi:peptide/nickel transport system substrate-binding protein
MPKHIFEKVEDPRKFDFNPPVSINAYTMHSFDPNGRWFIWQRREDWKRTSLGRFGEPGPTYVAYIDPGPPDKRVIEHMNHQLDIIHDTSPEGMFTIVKESKSAKTWFKGFPYGHPDPTLPAVLLNTQVPKLQNKDVRWALALLIDIKAVAMASYRGAATLSAIGVPPTGLYPKYYFEPMEGWLKTFEVDTGKQKVKPYDPGVGEQIAAMLRPSLGDKIPSTPEDIATAFGRGWWKRNTEAATELLEKAGLKKSGSQWLMPDGKPFSVKITVEGDTRPTMTRAGSMIAQQWRQFGIDSKIVVAQGNTMINARAAGDYEAMISWSVETWGGHPDLSFFLDSWHSEFVAKPGEPQTARNWQRWSDPRLDKIIEGIRNIGFDDPKGVEYGIEYLKLVANEMPTIPLMAYNVFTVMDTTYWEGFPSSTDPYTDPVPNWANTKYMMVKLKPTKA